MTIIAQLNSLPDAYAGMEALRAKAIPPALSKSGEFLIISVDDDFANSARQILSSDGRFIQYIRLDGTSLSPGFEEWNA